MKSSTSELGLRVLIQKPIVFNVRIQGFLSVKTASLFGKRSKAIGICLVMLTIRLAIANQHANLNLGYPV